MPEFVVYLKLMINTERARQMEYNGATANDESTLERVENITLMSNNYFHSLNVSNSCNIPIIYKKLLAPFYYCDTEDNIALKCSLPHN